MAIHYSNGFGTLYDKEEGETVAEIKYLLIETDQTTYSPKKWWGEFSTNREIKQLGNYLIKFENDRKSECVISINTERKKGTASNYHYRFHGRGKLGKRFIIGS